MKIHHLALASFVALAAVPAQATENTPYFGFKAGWMDADASGHDNALNIGGVFGYKFFQEPHGSGALEGEVTTTLKDGDMSGGGDWDVGTIAIYFAYRTAGEVFLKAKAGVADQNVGGTSALPDDTGLVFGFGVGWQATRKASLEFEYTIFDDINFVSIGYNTHF